MTNPKFHHTGALAPATVARFEEKFELDDRGCWIWKASRDRHGYGHFGVPGFGAQSAHRVAYEHYTGPIPEGLELDHLCRVRECVNPAHLDPVTRMENLRRVPLYDHGEHGGVLNSRKTTCPQGHAYAGDNLWLTVDSKGRTGRRCRACVLESNRRSRAAKRRSESRTGEDG